MTWYQCIALLTVWIAMLLILFEGYAWFLRCVAHLASPIKQLLTMLACFFTITVTFSPVLGIEFILGLFWSSVIIRSVVIQSILGCQWFSIAFFYIRHVKSLQKLGYFK